METFKAENNSQAVSEDCPALTVNNSNNCNEKGQIDINDMITETKELILSRKIAGTNPKSPNASLPYKDQELGENGRKEGDAGPECRRGRRGLQRKTRLPHGQLPQNVFELNL